MASTSHLVAENFIWRIESISPTATECNFGPFRYLDTPHVMADELTPGRRFDVDWSDSSADHETDDVTLHCAGSSRVADHTFAINVYYPADVNHRALLRTMLQDRHDLIAQLGLGSSFTGYDADNTSTDIGLWRRYRVEDGRELDSAAGVFVYTQVWRCTIYETE